MAPSTAPVRGGDGWDQMQYGRDFDFNRPFFEQYDELRMSVPHTSLVSPDSVNSEYSNQSQNNKDCYMVSASGSNEKCTRMRWHGFSSFRLREAARSESGEQAAER